MDGYQYRDISTDDHVNQRILTTLYKILAEDYGVGDWTDVGQRLTLGGMDRDMQLAMLRNNPVHVTELNMRTAMEATGLTAKD